MRNEEELTPAEREFQETLGGLRFADASMDRDRLLFRAGQLAARRRGRIWQASTVVLIAIAANCSVFWTFPAVSLISAIVLPEPCWTCIT